MSTTRRNTLIRSITGLCGDIAVSVAIASTCVWIIEAASLGLFLSFLLWLVGALASLAMSQLVIHPAVSLLLSDQKLDLAVNALADAGKTLDMAGNAARLYLRSSWSHIRPAAKA